MRELKDDIFGRAHAAYVRAYQAKYGRKPLDLADASRSKLWSVIKRVKQVDSVCKIIEHYLSIDGIGSGDTWFRKQGHSIECLSQSINQVYADWASSESETRDITWYVNGFSKCGCAILETKSKRAHDNFKPIKFQEWIRLPTHSKLQDLKDDPKYGFSVEKTIQAIKEQFPLEQFPMRPD